MYEIIYASAARRLFDPAQLGALLEQARRNNARSSVSGILLYEAGSFLQVLEGDEGVVRTLYGRIAQDERHYRVRVVREGPVARRGFAEWSMGFVALDNQLFKEFPKRHSLRSNGSLVDDGAPVVDVLDAFRNGQWRSYILG